MRKTFQLLALLAAGWIGAQAAQGSTNCAASSRSLLIDPCSARVPHGKATLIIGVLRRTNGVYAGDYKIKVTPYFFKGEKGRLAIVVSDESLDEIMRGNAEAVTGTATTNGKRGKSRHIDATVMPIDINHGTLQVRFAAGHRKMIFEPAYRFDEKRTAGPASQTTVNNIASKFP